MVDTNQIFVFFRLTALADYQYLVDPSDPMFTLRKALGSFDGTVQRFMIISFHFLRTHHYFLVDTLEKFKFAEGEDGRDLRNMPPPIFSRIEWSQNYG
jgi:hypothetical protein